MKNDRQSRIRNFSIIAHIDHGKSTLADRLIQITGQLTEREMEDQILDTMELERERGITIKLQTTRLKYVAKDGIEYTLNLIDTPGHVDFTYEVSRSLAACEGAVLVVDAAQGVEAQTMANVHLADDVGLEIVPVLNKIDLPSARPDEIIKEIEDDLAIIAEDAPRISAKDGINIEAVLEAVVEKVPAPSGDESKPFKALIFDSIYNSYTGAIAYVRVFDGQVKKGDIIKMMASGIEYEVTEVGIHNPKQYRVDVLRAGDVGYITASIKNVKDCRVGDTLTSAINPTKEALPGYKKVTPMVFCGIYPLGDQKVDDVRDALEKLQLNDGALVYEAETSVALGYGFRCGFLGLLHLEIIQERMIREFDLDIISTAPSVIYNVILNNGEKIKVQNPSNLPDLTYIDYMEEPIVRADIMVLKEYVGNVMALCEDRRGTMLDMNYLDERKMMLHYELPLNEVIYDFFDTLKSITKGYGSLDYELIEYRKSDLVKLDVLINKERIDAFSMILHKSSAVYRGRRICKKLQQTIPKHMFAIPIQAAIGSDVIARENVKAMRKDVTSKCYGGDITRKKKLLEKQKKGKKRMQKFGKVDVPQKAFLEVLKYDDES
jgi:GTP-binding protein LepA